MNTTRTRFAAARLAFVTALAVAAPVQPAAAQGVHGDRSAIPSPEEFLGYALGADFTDHAGIRDYAEMLGQVSPYVEYLPYGETVEGRELIQLAIATPAHHARLDDILAVNAELTHASTTESRAREIAATNPAVVYFGYGVHGNESSSSEAALWTAYDLITGAPDVTGVLDSVVVIIDPVTNPDGRDRYVSWYRSVVGTTPNPDPQTREHREPWPGGRFNHYLFDLNRDWAWMTQPETRARIATWWRWNPQVHVDFHEMSPDATYFFFPATAPVNPIYPDHVLEWGRHFGKANAGAFDVEGWPYFTNEGYDLLYPGYGDSWPSLHGAIGMTYEQAGGGSAGLAFARTDGDTLTLRDRATHHRVAGNATLRVAAAGKSRLLLDFAAAHQTAGQGSPDILLVPGADPARLDALVEHLLGQGIHVERAQSDLRVSARPYPGYSGRRDFPAGTALVRARQPRGRVAVTLLQPETELRAEFSYDISAWSLPYAYGVEAHQTSAPPAAAWAPAAPSTTPVPEVPPSDFGYLVAPGDLAARAIVRYLSDDGLLRVLARPTTFGGREWPAGTWFIPASNTAGREALETAGFGTSLVPISGGLSQGGIDLGSANAPVVRLPRVALVGGEGIVPTSYGAHWFYLEQEVGMGFDAILLPELHQLDLARYDVIVLPDMSGDLPEDARDALDDWIAAGGRLVAVAGGAAAAASLADVELREAHDNDEDDTAALDRLLATREERERREWREEVPGTILPVRLDPRHPLTWGAGQDASPERLFVLHEGGRSFEPRADAEAAGAFEPGLQAISGVISPESLGRLERSAWLLTRSVGRGHVTLFADDPLFRLFWHTTKPLYLNALLYEGM